MKKHEDMPEVEEAQPLYESDPVPAEPKSDEWLTLVMLWSDKSNAVEMAKVLKAELAIAGIESVDQLSKTSVHAVIGAVRAALKSDAQALLSAAHKLGGK